MTNNPFIICETQPICAIYAIIAFPYLLTLFSILVCPRTRLQSACQVSVFPGWSTNRRPGTVNRLSLASLTNLIPSAFRSSGVKQPHNSHVKMKGTRWSSIPCRHTGRVFSSQSWLTTHRHGGSAPQSEWLKLAIHSQIHGGYSQACLQVFRTEYQTSYAKYIASLSLSSPDLSSSYSIQLPFPLLPPPFLSISTYSALEGSDPRSLLSTQQPHSFYALPSQTHHIRSFFCYVICSCNI